MNDDVDARPTLEMDAASFERLVIDELDQLPDDMVDGLDNVIFVVEDRPEDGSLDLLGLYDGWALTERDRYGVGELPDRIIVYREPHLAACETEDELRDEVHTTLVHEIAHFYGIDDELVVIDDSGLSPTCVSPPYPVITAYHPDHA